jgi:HEAT repeat protein
MAHRDFDEQMAVLDALKGSAPDAASVRLVKKALGNRSNLLVAKAASLAEEGGLAELLPELLAAFDRFFSDAEKSDPQCWAKNALSHALGRLRCRDKEVFLRGLHHRQMEPVWGGKSDSAGTLRANCAHALVTFEELSYQELLLILLDPLLDPDKSVRVEAVRAMGQIGPPAVPVLRLRALVGGGEPEVLAACFGVLLEIERTAGIPFVAGFLEAGDDAAAEAAFALAETRLPEAAAVLLNRQSAGADEWFGKVLLSAIALTRQPEATEFLIDLIARDADEAPVALQAIGHTAPSEEMRRRVEEAVEQANSARLRALLQGPDWAQGQ